MLNDPTLECKQSAILWPTSPIFEFTHFNFPNFPFVLLLPLSSVERTDLSYPPIISALNSLGPAADFLAPGDRIHQIDGISTIGLTNNHVLNLLLSGDQAAVIEIEYSLPDYSKLILRSFLLKKKIAHFWTLE